MFVSTIIRAIFIINFFNMNEYPSENYRLLSGCILYLLPILGLAITHQGLLVSLLTISFSTTVLLYSLLKILKNAGQAIGFKILHFFVLAQFIFLIKNFNYHPYPFPYLVLLGTGAALQSFFLLYDLFRFWARKTDS
jgi:hypothetical protein